MYRNAYTRAPTNTHEINLEDVFCILVNLCVFSQIMIMVVAGYGFVDYETAQAAETAIKALLSNGIQVQMAKVSLCLSSS